MLLGLIACLGRQGLVTTRRLHISILRIDPLSISVAHRGTSDKRLFTVDNLYSVH